MSSPDPVQKRRPPPIEIPPFTQSRVVPGPNAFALTAQNKYGPRDHQQGDKDASATTQRAARSVSNTPQTSPREPDGMHLPRSGSQTGKSRGSAMTTFTSLMDQARGSSPRKSDHGSSTVSRRGSTARSRQSNHSYQSAISGQSRLEALEEVEKTARGEYETRTEKRFFKMMGQIPPTPTDGTEVEEHGPVRTNDLREKCKDVGKKSDREDLARSPKKKLFGMSIPSFKASGNVSTPQMPTKAAEVLGTKARQPRHYSPRPIKPVGPIKPSLKIPRSDTSKSLPSKLFEPHSHSRRQHYNAGGSTRSRNRNASHRSPVKVIENSDSKVHEVLVPPSFDFAAPPTPPKKDTPPKFRSETDTATTQPTHQSSLVEDLHEGYGLFVDTGMKLQIPSLAKAPEASAIPSGGGKSPTKFCPYGAEDYAKLIEGERINSAYGEVDFAHSEQQIESSRHEPPHEQHNGYCNQLTKHSTAELLQPTVYTPPKRSIQGSQDHETPSKTLRTNRLLFAIQPKHRNIKMREDPKRGSIGIIFQGNASEIDPNSNTGKMIHNTVQESAPLRKEAEPDLATRVVQELQDSKQQEASLRGGQTEYSQPQQSSSRLTEILNGVSPTRTSFNTEFNPNCLSAVPSPLHRGGLQPHTTPFDPRAPQINSLQTPQTMEDHFYMTNSHVDCSGQILYDFIDECKHQQLAAISSKHDHLVGTLEQRIEDIKSQINSASEKADYTLNQNHNIHTKLDKLFEYIKAEVIEPLAIQTRKITGMENEVRELQKTMRDVQNSFTSREDQCRAHAIQETRNDGRFRYGSNLNHPLSGSNPYTGYMGGYQGYNFTPSPPEQHYVFK